MPLTYPRLRSTFAEPLVERFRAAPLHEVEQEWNLLPREIEWAPTGPPRITLQRLQTLRQEIRAVAASCGYAYGAEDGRPAVTPEAKAALDSRLAACLHRSMDITPNEAAEPGVWRYMTCVLAPELVRWRFDGDAEQGSGARRFGGNRLRNTLGRLWWRAHLLQDADVLGDDPTWLVAALGEDELVQITERPNAAGYPPLTVGLARTLLGVFDGQIHRNRSRVLREAMKRLLRWLPLICPEALDPADLDDLLFSLFSETLVGLGFPAPTRAARPVPEAPEPAPQDTEEPATVAPEPVLPQAPTPVIAATIPDDLAPEEDEGNADDEDISDAPTEDVPRPPPLLSTLALPFPEPPSKLRTLLARSGARTVQDVLALDPDGVTALPGVGATKARALADWQRTLRGLYAESAIFGAQSPATRLPMLLSIPLPEPPDLLKRNIEQLGWKTLGDLVAIDIRAFAAMDGVGKARVEALKTWRLELCTAFAIRDPAPPPPKDDGPPWLNSLAALHDVVLAGLDAREREVLRVRYDEDGTLDEAGRALGVSRERARQVIGRIIQDAHGRFGDNARALLEREWRLGELGADFLFANRSHQPTVPFQQLRLLVEIATNERWVSVGERWLSRASQVVLENRMALVERAFSDRMEIIEDDLAAFLLAHPELPLPFVEAVLGDRLEMLGDLSVGFRRDPQSVEPRVWLAWVMRRHGQAAHQDEIARWLARWEGLDPDRLDQAALGTFVRRIEGMADRIDDLLRVERGTFIHRAHLSRSAIAERAVDWCVRRMAGETGPVSTLVLVDELQEAGIDAGGLNHYLLKGLLCQRPEIRKLRKSLVAFAATFNEEGVDMEDRIVAVLEQASKPLTVQEVMEQLPVGLRYSKTSVSLSLSSQRYARNVGLGRFVIDHASEE